MINILLLILAYFFMEFVAWFSHKYVMHGFLWNWHQDHHHNDIKLGDKDIHEHKGFEKNDLFFLIYAIPAIILMIIGLAGGYGSLIYIAVGIALYGLTYFIIHDVIYHKRLKIRLLKKNTSRYIKAVVKAHGAHHKPKDKSDFESYGLLIFPKRFLKD